MHRLTFGLLLFSSLSSGCASSSHHKLSLFLFILAQLFWSFGSTCLWIHGPVYLDQNVTAKHMNIHLGVMYASAALGPAFGYLLSGQLLNMWVDPEKGKCRLREQQTRVSVAARPEKRSLVSRVLTLSDCFVSRMQHATGPPPNLTPTSSDWIGAWWIGYAITFCMAMVFVGPIACFPKQIPEPSGGSCP